MSQSYPNAYRYLGTRNPTATLGRDVPSALLAPMPKLVLACSPLDENEDRQIRKLAGSPPAPGDWIMRARMIVDSWEGKRTAAIAQGLGCHPQTVRERINRFNAEGIDRLGDRQAMPGERESFRQAALAAGIVT